MWSMSLYSNFSLSHLDLLNTVKCDPVILIENNPNNLTNKTKEHFWNAYFFCILLSFIV